MTLQKSCEKQQESVLKRWSLQRGESRRNSIYQGPEINESKPHGHLLYKVPQVRCKLVSELAKLTRRPCEVHWLWLSQRSLLRVLAGASGAFGASAKPFPGWRREGPASSHLGEANSFSVKIWLLRKTVPEGQRESFVKLKKYSSAL